MNATGVSNLLVEARSALLDALQALEAHRSNVVVVGAQAIYLRSVPGINIALAEMTKDSDIALDARALADQPLIEEASDLCTAVAAGRPRGKSIGRASE